MKPLVSRVDGQLGTMLSNMGLLIACLPGFDPTDAAQMEAIRWMTMSELLTAMGQPITEEHQKVTGVQSQFSRGVQPPPRRSRVT